MKSHDLIKVWDLPLRIFHWLLVAGFFVAYLTEDELLTIHVWGVISYSDCYCSD
jgi:cytochrome b